MRASARHLVHRSLGTCAPAVKIKEEAAALAWAGLETCAVSDY
jgi:hypothetical protein